LLKHVRVTAAKSMNSLKKHSADAALKLKHLLKSTKVARRVNLKGIRRKYKRKLKEYLQKKKRRLKQKKKLMILQIQ